MSMECKVGSLTERQAAALTFLAEGGTCDEMALIWDIDLVAARSLVRRARESLGADTIAQAVALVEVEQRLTARQLECVRMLAVGYTFAQIGRRLGIAKNVVDAHLRAARERLGARTNTHLVAVAARRGLLSQRPAGR
jgi:DNA-binding CsgD family transcriptional regulator